MNRKDLIEELHRLKDAIKAVNDDLYLIEDDLINSCDGNHSNMVKYIEAIYDGLNSSNNITKAITNLHINKALYELIEAVEQLESAVENVSDIAIEKLGSLGYAGDQVLENLSTVDDGIAMCIAGMDRAISRMDRLR